MVGSFSLSQSGHQPPEQFAYLNSVYTPQGGEINSSSVVYMSVITYSPTGEEPVPV